LALAGDDPCGDPGSHHILFRLRYRYEVQFILIVGLLGAIFFQVSQLVKALEKSNDNMTSFLDSIRFDDLSSSFKTDSHDPRFSACTGN